MALEKGLTGLLLLIVLQSQILYALGKGMQKSNGSSHSALSRYLFASYLGLFIFEVVLSIIEVFTVSYMVLGSLLIIHHREYDKLQNYPNAI